MVEGKADGWLNFAHPTRRLVASALGGGVVYCLHQGNVVLDMTAFLALGQRIACLRRQIGLSLDQLAERLGISAQAVSK